MLPPKDAVDSVFQLLQNGSKQVYIGEEISQLEHALQAAFHATQQNADEETVLAALLHDIGQFCPAKELQRMLVEDLGNQVFETNKGIDNDVSVGVMGHERLGAEYLCKLGFSKKICELVESHVVAKRYLTAKSPDYYASLSNASKLSLKFQGGICTPAEARVFENDPLFKEKVQLRKWDDASKVVGLQTPGLDVYRDMAIQHLESTNKVK
ncbi:hypothetical protein COEREDRAFT_69732 [Coemansia reversa NRRL 1564]|uniref:HD domain-containing protein n=1 Tax=Coemansia reversa (strain ATCC 12441 / NRRL 1564) TaxID=763665 RepID=A0A2G5BJ25_COERN|nr:hypothetical protein COEREDRAFT_69732 [Coemansia reversa NRRL 1564]|eukprot:PIA19034.1 hypothetical protein COEREDRAFT_69732 [Coemansia reversa NRRL 1564]